MFGDDLGDTGNLRQLLNDSSIGYGEGRLTNGPTFGEYMATALGLKHKSYAYAQSIVNADWHPAQSGIGQGLDAQVMEFTEKERDWIRRKAGVHSSIAVVSSGTTDVIQWAAEHLNQTVAGDQGFSRSLVDHVFEQVRALEKLGAFKAIIVTNLPALYIMPRWRLLASVDALRVLVVQTNQLFRQMLLAEQQREKDTKLWMLDIEAFLLTTANMTFAQDIGAKNTTGACITDRGSCSDPADFVFYDDAHMDVRLNHLLGLAAANTVMGGGVQYNTTYFRQLADDFDIGVVYHTTATMPAETEDASVPSPSIKADPLLTSATSSTLANCSLTAMCTTITPALLPDHPSTASPHTFLAHPRHVEWLGIIALVSLATLAVVL
ncbi:hypothetical protein GGF46_001719 [Coemansia sp. RSA 552]|nr:hypothetical protein GGF46_001719 [Coemansia sp. RSA 552]